MGKSNLVGKLGGLCVGTRRDLDKVTTPGKFVNDGTKEKNLRGVRQIKPDIHYNTTMPVLQTLAALRLLRR
jgi:hypothetical protein